MYNKLFSKILDSSIWSENHATVRVWITFLALMDETGFAQAATVANLARRANVSLPEVHEALEKLEGPDIDSSDPEEEGRRIERVPGGWMVLNAVKYRQLVSRDLSKQRTAERVRRHREKKKAVTQEALHEAKGAFQVGERTLHVAKRNDSVTQSEAEAEVQTKNLPGKSARRVSDPRHEPFKRAVHASWAENFPGESLAPWGAAEAKNLSTLLNANPTLTVAKFQELLENRARSELNLAEPPQKWLATLTRFASGPLDQYNRPKQVRKVPIMREETVPRCEQRQRQAIQ